ncbi:MAG: hypothetical protein MJ123_11775 [Lachnospiraceae bacterium]|nr:hypothetical protein [Lachnospiraceae bacterium]
MDFMFLLLAYVPVASLIIGVICLTAFFLLRYRKRKIVNWLFVLGCIGIGLTLLVYCFFFLVGFLGIGPMAS